MEGLLLYHSDAMDGPDEGAPVVTLTPLCDEINEGEDSVFSICALAAQLSLLPLERQNVKKITKGRAFASHVLNSSLVACAGSLWVHA